MTICFSNDNSLGPLFQKVGEEGVRHAQGRGIWITHVHTYLSFFAFYDTPYSTTALKPDSEF